MQFGTYHIVSNGNNVVVYSFFVVAPISFLVRMGWGGV